MSQSGTYGRPAVPREIRDLIRDMSRANPLWGSPRIVGELRKLGINVAKSTVETYRVRLRKPPSPTWKVFLNNHVKDLVALDFFVVPTSSYKVLFVLVILAHERRLVVHFTVTAHPTAEWTAQQEVLDHVIILNEWHLRRVLQAYLGYYHRWRTHLSLMMDCPHPRPIQPLGMGKVMAVPEVAGLHHHYERRTAS